MLDIEYIWGYFLGIETGQYLFRLAKAVDKMLLFTFLKETKLHYNI